MMAMTSAPFLYQASSATPGRRTFSTTSASLTASFSTIAPAALYSESGMPDFTPAPGSTATSAPSALSFLTVSGVAATRSSSGSSSAAMATFMMPPAAGPRGRHQPAMRWDAPGAADAAESGEENPHQDEKHDNESETPLHK